MWKKHLKCPIFSPYVIHVQHSGHEALQQPSTTLMVQSLLFPLSCIGFVTTSSLASNTSSWQEAVARVLSIQSMKLFFGKAWLLYLQVY